MEVEARKNHVRPDGCHDLSRKTERRKKDERARGGNGGEHEVVVTASACRGFGP